MKCRATTKMNERACLAIDIQKANMLSSWLWHCLRWPSKLLKVLMFEMNISLINSSSMELRSIPYEIASNIALLLRREITERHNWFHQCGISLVFCPADWCDATTLEKIADDNTIICMMPWSYLPCFLTALEMLIEMRRSRSNEQLMANEQIAQVWYWQLKNQSEWLAQMQQSVVQPCPQPWSLEHNNRW